MKQLKFIAPLAFCILIFHSCGKKGCTDPSANNFNADADKYDGSCTYDPISPKLIFKFKFDPNQERLDNFGNLAGVPAGHAAQTPRFNLMGAHYIELADKNDIPAYSAEEIYKGVTTTQGGSSAIDFDSAAYAGDDEVFYTIDLDNISPGTYKYLRISLSYQNYDIDFQSNGFNLQGTIASFVGANTYVRSYKVKDETINVNANKLQGYWAFETDFQGVPTIEGQAPAGATTVPNPIASSSAIPAGSCLVTGIFENDFVITGEETEDVEILCSISINNSFEWKDPDGNGIYNPTEGDTVVDMGVRGLIPIVQ
ncbi:MAG: hypothetical protein MRY83_22545 [Flavobacteriales bacterium]|nr:hypothetical protein [Flavobacteriales bacterium]